MERPPVILDTESQSPLNLEDIGGRNYWRSPYSRMLCLCGNDPERGPDHRFEWLPGHPWPYPDRDLAAHNARTFDRHACAAYGIRPARRWYDTSNQARKAGLSGGLDALAKTWAGLKKDKAGHDFTIKLSKLGRPLKGDPNYISAKDWKELTREEKIERGYLPNVTPRILERVVQYCHNDIEPLATTWKRIKQWIPIDAEAEALDEIINDRGVYYDVDLARALLEDDRWAARKAIKIAARELGMSVEDTATAARSPKQFQEITGAPNMQKGTVADLDHPLAVVRRALGTIAGGKLAKGLELVDEDNRVRDAFVYGAAGTLRWSSVGVQFQNQTSPSKAYDGWTSFQVDELAQRVLEGKHRANQAEINLLLRATVCAPPGEELLAFDLKGIEQRFAAWGSGDTAELERIRTPGYDPYVHSAAAALGKRIEDITAFERKFGKQLYLGCQYSQAGGTFAKTCAKYGIDLEALGVDPDVAVMRWRKLRAPLVRHWKNSDKAFRAAIAGHVTHLGPYTFAPSDDGKAVIIWLASGRPMVYNGARLVVEKDAREGAPKGATKVSIGYDGTRSLKDKRYDIHGRIFTPLYGGKIVENVTQADCRDVFARAMVRVEKAGIPIMLHAHDELVASVRRDEVKDAKAEIVRIMTSVPKWTPGLPLGVSGWTGPRYMKA